MKELPILLSSDTLNCLYLPLPGNTDVLPVTRSESGCFPSHPVCSHLSCLPLISFHLPPVMFSSCPCLTAACFPLGQVFFDAWPQHQASSDPAWAGLPMSDKVGEFLESSCPTQGLTGEASDTDVRSQKNGHVEGFEWVWHGPNCDG